MNPVALAFESLGGKQLLHKSVTTWQEFHLLTEERLPRDAAAFFAKRYHLGFEELSLILGVDKRTLGRKPKAGLWQLAQSDRLAAAAQIYAEVEQLFGSREEAARWMKAGNPDLGGRPIDFLHTDAGRQAIRDTLTRIEYGVFG